MSSSTQREPAPDDRVILTKVCYLLLYALARDPDREVAAAAIDTLTRAHTLCPPVRAAPQEEADKQAA